jgi:autotransporter-associated beta strand protein
MPLQLCLYPCISQPTINPIPVNPTPAMINKIQLLRPGHRRSCALSLAASLAFAGALQASTVTETFDSAESATTNGWTGVGNTTTNNNYGWSNTNDAGDAAGEAGGIFARTTALAYYADTNGGTLSRTAPLVMSGNFSLLNDTFDGTFKLGFFNTQAIATNFIGINISEPSGASIDPFRGYAAVEGVGGASTPGASPILLAQDTPLTFNLTWTPSNAADGSGTLTGTIGGTDIGTIVVGPGSGTFNAFGLVSGGLGNSSAAKTAGCYFDDLTYTAATPTTYTITYDGNGNTGGTAPDAQVKTENQAITLASNSGNLVKDSLTFSGWNTAADGTGTNYAAGASYTGNADVTLYARWATPTDVLYWDNDGSGDRNLWGNTANWSSDAAGGVDPVAFPGELDTAIFHASSVSTDQTIETRGDRSVQGLEFTTANTAAIRSNTAADQNSVLTIGSSGIDKTGTGTVTMAHTAATIVRRLDIALSANQTWQNNNATGNLTIGFLTTTANSSGFIKPTLGGGNRILTLDGTNTTASTGMRLNSSLQDASVSDVLSVVKEGAGTWTLSSGQDSNRGASTFTGGLTVKEGLLIALANSATANPEDLLGKGFVTLEGGTVSFRASGTANTTAQNIAFDNNIAMAGNATIDVRRTGAAAQNKTIILDKLTIGAHTLDVTGGEFGYQLRFKGITTLTGNATFNPTTSPLTLAGVIGETGGSHGLTKSGGNSLTLSAENTYTGDTVVNTGTLIVTGGNAIPDTGKLVINTGGKVNPSGTTETVATLFFGAEQQIAGTWGATGSGASNINDTYFTGTGVVSVATGPTPANTYSTWATTNGAGANLNDDHDNDGVDNGVEFFLVGPTGNSTGFTALPGVVTTAGVRSITWTKAADYPGVYGTDFQVETSETLAAGSWTTETVGGNITITGNDVKYTFPAGPTKKFARLVVTGP